MPARAGNTILAPGGRILRKHHRHPRPRGRSVATRTPRPRPKPASAPPAPKPAKSHEAAKARRDAARAAKAVKEAAASRPIDTLRRAEAKLEKHHDPKLREAARKLRHALASEAAFKAARKTPEGSPVKANFPDEALKSVAPRAYEKAKRTARAGGHGSSRGLGEPEDLTTAITVAAPGGGFVGALGKRALEVGGKQVAKDVGEALAGKVESATAKTGLKAVRAGSGVKAAGRLAGNLARRAAGKETKKAGESAAKAAFEKAAARGEARTAQAAVPAAKLAKVSGGQLLPVVRGHEQALVRNPKAVAKRTAVGAEGLVLGPVKAAADIAFTGGRAASSAAHELHIPGARGYSGKEILAPVKGLADEQLAFAKQVAKVITASDPSYVQKEVEDNLGLMLPVVLGLGGKAAGEKLTKGRVVEGVRQIANRARKEPLDHFRGETPRVFEEQAQHKESARTVANARLRARRDEQGAIGRYVDAARSVEGGEVVRRDVRPKKGHAARIARGGLARAEAEGHLVIRPGDAVPYVVRHAIDLSHPERALEQIRAAKAALKDLPEGVKLSKDELHTRDVVDYIERNPELLAQIRRAADERRKAGAYRREHSKELEPEHSERARYEPVATAKGRPLPEHMYPRDVRDIVRAEPEHGVLAKDVLRKEAREDKARARALRRKAGTAVHKANVLRGELAAREKLNKTNLEQPLSHWQIRELKALKEMERRGLVPRGQAPVGGHLQVVTPERGKLPTKTLPARHERIRERIDKLDSEAVALREQAARAEEMGKRKNKARQGFDHTLEKEFADREAAELRAEGRPQPEYVHTGSAIGGEPNRTPGNKFSPVPGKSKFRKGTAEAHGMVSEGLAHDVRESFRRPTIRRESYRAMREVIDANEFRLPGKDEWTSKEISELFDPHGGVLKRNQWVAIPRQLYNRAYGKFDPEGAMTDWQKALDGKTSGSHFKLVRRPAAEEFFSQLSDHLVSEKLVTANRWTNFLILATSPAWAAAQVAAEYTQGAVAQPKLLNPKWVKKARAAYEAMPPHKRQAFDSWVGVTTRELNRKEEQGFGTVEDAADAYSALHATPLGRILTSIHDFDQWKGGRIRTLVTIAKADKELNGHLNGFVRGLGKLDEEMGRQLKAMRGKPLREQLSYIADHPKLADRYQRYLDDVMGNWTALTKNERVASQLMIFYPFLRMSLRWTFYAFPKHHPIRAAALAYLSQQNATEIKRLLGGDPSYFTGWLKVPVSLGNGKHDYVPLSRIVPGANAITEALGGGIEGPKGTVALRTVQPTIGAVITLASGVNPLTGKQEKGSFWQAMKELFPTNLSAPGRALDEALVPAGRKPAEGPGQSISPILGTERQRALDKLSAKLRGYGSAQRYARNLLLPLAPEDGQKVRDSELLGRVVKALSRNSSSARDDVSTEYANKIVDATEEGKHAAIPALRRERDKRLSLMKGTEEEAQAALDKLFKRYKIPFQKEDRVFLQAYDEGKYGTDSSNPWSGGGSSSSSSNPWAASSSGSEHNPWSGK
jgi:hypothetical protein